MEKNTTPNIFKPDYLLKELVDLLNNDPASAPRLFENLMNADYDFESKDGFYRLLNEEQRTLLKRIYLRRQESEEFDMRFQMIVLVAAGMVGIGYGAVKLIERIDAQRQGQSQ